MKSNWVTGFLFAHVPEQARYGAGHRYKAAIKLTTESTETQRRVLPARYARLNPFDKLRAGRLKRIKENVVLIRLPLRTARVAVRRGLSIAKARVKRGKRRGRLVAKMAVRINTTVDLRPAVAGRAG